MTSSQIGAQIDSCWGKVFGKEASSGGATAFRKAVVSAVQEFQQEIIETTWPTLWSTTGKPQTVSIHCKIKLNQLRKHRGEHRGKIMHGTTKAKSDTESRHKWTVQEETALKTLFSEQIENHSISLAEVRSISQKILSCPICHTLLSRTRYGLSLKRKSPSLWSYRQNSNLQKSVCADFGYVMQNKMTNKMTQVMTNKMKIKKI